MLLRHVTMVAACVAVGASATSCDQVFGLDRGAGPDATADVVAKPKRVFLTRGRFHADFPGQAAALGIYTGTDGVLAADALCALEASVLAPGRWKAWLSAGTAARSRFDDQDSPRVNAVRTDEIVMSRIGVNPMQLVPDIDGSIDPQSRAPRAWTGTDDVGLPAPNNGGPSCSQCPADCMRWTLGSSFPSDRRGAAGDPNDAQHWSFQFGAEYCETRASLYCIED